MDGMNTAKKRWYTPEEMKQIRKSDFYREDLASLLGKQIIIDAPYYEFKPFTDDKNRACLRKAEVIGAENYYFREDRILTIDHIWVAIQKNVKIDARKPLRIFGIPYEYAHHCGSQIVRNVGLKVGYVTQCCFSPD